MDLAEYQGRLIEDLRGRLLDLERRVKRLEPGQCRPVMRKRNWIPALPPNPEEWMGQYTGTFMARITDQGTNDHSFVEVYWVVGTGWATLTDGRTGTKNSATGARDLNGRTGVPTGTIVMMYEQLTDTFGTQYVFDITQGDETGGAALDLTGATGSWDVESQEGPPAKRGATVNLLYLTGSATGTTYPVTTVYTFSSRQFTVDANGNLVAIAEPAGTLVVNDQYVKATDGDGMPDVLYDGTRIGPFGKLATDETWIDISDRDSPYEAGYREVYIEHIGPDPKTGSDYYVTIGADTIVLTVDARGHVLAFYKSGP